MTFVLVIILLALVGWLFLRWTELRERVASAEARLNNVELELGRLKQVAPSEAAPAPTVVPQAAPPPPPAPAAVRPPPIPQAPLPARVPMPAPSVAPSQPQAIRPEPQPAFHTVNWEKFLGVKLFAWLGGFALFLGVAFFVKYSFDNNLITAPMRIGLGYLTGIGLIAGAFCLSRERQAVTIQTLSATGILILYATTFAAHARYEFFGTAVAFGLMSVATIGAFTLAVRLNAQVVAILGLLGGFLTPPLLSTGVDNPVGLFGYLALLDVGLIAIALRQRWNHLILLAAVATVMMQFGWVGKFFAPHKVDTAVTIFLGFATLFTTAFGIAHRRQQTEKYLSAATLLMPASALAFAFQLLTYNSIARQPGLLFSYVLLADALLLLAAWLRPSLRFGHAFAGGAVFLFLGAWTAMFLRQQFLNIALLAYLLFALLHSIAPALLERRRGGAKPPPAWSHLFPALSLVLVLVPLIKLSAASWSLWPVILLIDLLAIVMAILAASLIPIMAVVLLTALLAAAWIFKVPAELPSVPGLMVIVGGFGLFFMAAAAFAARKLGIKTNEPGAAGRNTFASISTLTSITPFLLLILMLLRLPLQNPTPVFALGAILVVTMLALVRFARVDALCAAGLFAALLLQYVWHVHGFPNGDQNVSVAWYLAFGLVFLIFPFLCQRHVQERVTPWVVSALSLPFHFFLIYNAFIHLYPHFELKGLIPAALAIPCLLAMGRIVSTVAPEAAVRNTLLALFGGASLFFITFVFPIQFERQWLTIGWALEGVALIWLFRSVPHPGLRIVGCALLATSFARLALNPWVITDYGRTGTPIWNWYLYTYGLVAVALFVAARLLAPPRHQIQSFNVPPVLYTLGTVLLFLLVNIQIADSFSGAGAQLTFNFSGAFAQDMAYSLAWALFAFALLSVGFRLKNSPTRYAGMGLLVMTLCKLFLHDLWRLGGLYRIGSLIGLAAVLIVVSFIYQRFLSANAVKKSG